ncbi:MAG: cobalamin biosynthesis protein P47K, partial [Planctomycetes bacterium]|nr:cobalamin biosynthesis protein P47K [Planctomycetota bacterium]
VDTAILSQSGAPVEEIAGGCFCCRFSSLQEAADNLEKAHQPEIFLAEPVGSCTDLVATVSYPMRRMYGDSYSIAPLTVVVDPDRALRVFSLRKGKKFSDKVSYIYKKQIEEAEAILLNKIDRVAEKDIHELKDFISRNYPDKKVFLCSAQSGIGLDEWMQWIEDRDLTEHEAMSMDYDIYADGEAELGWFNASVELQATQMLDGNQVILSIMNSVQKDLLADDVVIAHLKMTLSPEDGSGEIASANVVDNESIPAIGQKLMDDLQTGVLIINLRAQASPEVLRDAVHKSLQAVDCLSLEHEEFFRPGRPEPEYRMQSSDSSTDTCI